MSPDKDILENCLFNSENLLQQERWGKRGWNKGGEGRKKKPKPLNQIDENFLMEYNFNKHQQI